MLVRPARPRAVCSAAFVIALFAASLLQAQKGNSSLVDQLRALVPMAPVDRPTATLRAVTEIQALPPGLFKLQCADTLAQISMRDDPGAKALEAVAETLREALAEFGVNGNGAEPAEPYLDLARLVRYEHAGKALDDPRFRRAVEMLAAEDQKVEGSDFTLKDLQGHSYTLSQLRGKVVLVNFWATWCAPCRVEMPDLDSLYTRMKGRGLVVLAISNEEEQKVRSVVARMGFKAPVLLDPGAETGRRMGLDGLPRSFVFDREGKLVAVGIDKRSRRQFVEMLAQAGLHP
jgi:peroxiredoxin